MKLTCRIGCDKQQVYLMYGVSGTALDWIASYLSDRTQQVYYRGRLSAVSQLLFGVPQGSVLGPLLLLLYVAGVFEVIDESGCLAHLYADDLQVQLSAQAVRQTTAMDQLAECIIHIRDWMASHRLKLNEEKKDSRHLVGDSPAAG